jgi:large subunit ribosomal protein L13
MKLTKTTKSFDNTTVAQKWVLFDAEGQALGRLATKIAETIRGKNKAQYTAHNDCGDFVVVINAEKIKLTGNKLEDKKYFHHSQYNSGMKTKSAGEVLAKKPEKMIMDAVKSMLPKSKLSDHILTKLKVYKGSVHPHDAQQPIKA